MHGGDIRSRTLRLTPKFGWGEQRFWMPSITPLTEYAVPQLSANAGILHISETAKTHR